MHAELDRALAAAPLDAGAIQRLSGEVTFGYRAALEAWLGNDAARVGLARATRALIRYELAQGMAKSARARLADLEPPDDALRAEVDRANDLAEEQARRDAELRAELDPQTGRAARVRLISVVGGLWAVQPIAQHYGYLGKDADTNAGGAVMALVGGVVVGIGAFVFRRPVARSRLNRQLVATALLVLLVQTLAYGGAAILGLSAAMTQTILLFVWACMTGVLGVALDRKLLVPAIAFGCAFFVAAERRDARLLAEAAANVVLVVTAVLAWRPKERR